MKLSLRDLFWLVLVCGTGTGCALHNLGDPLPRAAPVRLNEVPPAAIESFRARYPDIENPKVERCVDERHGYRFALPGDGWVSYDKDGKLLGGGF